MEKMIATRCDWTSILWDAPEGIGPYTHDG